MYSVEEVYIAKVINDNGFNFNNLKSKYVFDINNKCVRTVNSYSDKSLFITDSKNNIIELDLDKVLILPTWNESRNWLKDNNFVLEFHYDPFREGNIKIGFMKPKSFTGTDNLVIESQGKTDLEVIYKIILEVVKYENSLRV
jgi:hypothetical protein